MSPKISIGTIFRFLAVTSGILLFQQGQALACSTNAWDDSNIGSTVSATTAASYEGDCGLRLNLNGNANGWVKDPTPGTANPAVTEYVSRFYAYIDEAQVANGQGITLFNALDSGSTELFGLEVNGSSSGPVLHLYANDGSIKEGTGDVPVSPGWRAITLHWTTGGNGQLKLIVDREQDGLTQAISGLSNAGQEIDAVQLGVVSGNSSGINGTIDVDSFTSRRTGTSGLIITKGCSGSNVTVEDTTFLPGAITCNASTALTFGSGVTLDDGATVIVQAQSVGINHGTRILYGAILDVSIQ